MNTAVVGEVLFPSPAQVQAPLKRAELAPASGEPGAHANTSLLAMLRRVNAGPVSADGVLVPGASAYRRVHCSSCHDWYRDASSVQAAAPDDACAGPPRVEMTAFGAGVDGFRVQLSLLDSVAGAQARSSCVEPMARASELRGVA